MKMRSLQPGNAKNVLKTAKKITKKEPLPAKQGGGIFSQDYTEDIKGNKLRLISRILLDVRVYIYFLRRHWKYPKVTKRTTISN